MNGRNEREGASFTLDPENESDREREKIIISRSEIAEEKNGSENEENERDGQR